MISLQLINSYFFHLKKRRIQMPLNSTFQQVLYLSFSHMRQRGSQIVYFRVKNPLLLISVYCHKNRILNVQIMETLLILNWFFAQSLVFLTMLTESHVCKKLFINSHFATYHPNQLQLTRTVISDDCDTVTTL